MRKIPVIAALACALLVSANAVPAFAYFTDTSAANGGLTLGIVPKTDISEKYATGTKHVVITNDETATSPVFVRARVFASDAFSTSIGGSNWSGPDAQGWYEYANPVEAGGATDELTVSITFPPVSSDQDVSGAQIGDNYNIVIIYESTPVLYDEAGDAYADWEFILDSGEAEGE